MNPNNRCIFSYDYSNGKWCSLVKLLFTSTVECDGLKDKQRCPFWAIADTLGRIETVIEMLEGRE